MVGATIIGLSPLALYLWGYSKLPENRLPQSLEVPQLAQELLWKDLGGSGQPQLAAENPYSYLFQLARNNPDLSNLRVSGLAADALLSREGHPKRQGHLVNASAGIWISRNWTASDALSAILNSAYFGHGFVGLYEASKGYYGVAPQELSELDMAQIIVLAKAPSKYDPWCSYDRNILRVKRLLGSHIESMESTGLLAKPVDACS